MERILLIEDSEIQIEWAQKSISSEKFELVVARNIKEMKEILLDSEFDYILLDMYVPQTGTDHHGVDHGFYEFHKMFEKYLRGEIKGLAIVSNYEHHIHGYEKGSGQSGHSNELDTYYEMGWRLNFDCMKKFEKGFVRSKRSLNTVVFYDVRLDLGYWNYLQKNEVKKVGNTTEDTYKLKEEIKKGEIVLLKPYEQIMDALSLSL